MPHIETSIEIEHPQEETFGYLTDLRNATEWSTELVDVTYDGELRQGTKGADTRKMAGKEIVMPWEVTVYERPHRVVFDYGRPFPATAEFSFRATDGGTLVSCNTELRPRGLWRLLGPLMAWEGKKADQAQFQKVKEILEGRQIPNSERRMA
jgi:uncharacterized protein YndB with AHSA1/START domain